MKALTCFILLIFPAFLLAQYEHSLQDPVPSNAKLFTLGKHIVLLHPIDESNRAHKWITFDSSLSITAAKKLVTPDAENITSQLYLENINSIMRVDQYLIPGGIEINAYIFDIEGNLLHRNNIAGATDTGKNFFPIPFYISQSPGKELIALVQTLLKNDSLLVSAMIIDNQLKLRNNVTFTVPFEAGLSDMYLPIVNDLETLLLPIADKFTSYKLNSALTLYGVAAGRKYPFKIQFDFNRKKIKQLTFNTPGDTLVFSGLFGEKVSRQDVTGWVYAGYDMKNHKFLPRKEYRFSDKISTSLKKMYGSEGRKGNLLNYLSMLPCVSNTSTKYSYGFLQPPAIRTQMKILDQASISSVARLNIAANALTDNTKDINRAFSPLTSQQKGSPKNLLFFSWVDSLDENGHHFIRIKSPADPMYDFFAFIPGSDEYSCLYYFSRGIGQPYLKKSTIDSTGTVIEKKIYEDRDRVLLTDYPFIVSQENLVAFYQDKVTGQTGLIKIRL